MAIRDPKLAGRIALVGAAIKSHDANDPRLKWLREFWAAALEGSMPPRNASPELIGDWERILRLVPDGLAVRDSRAVCMRCEVGAGIHTGPSVEGYGYRAACNNCGDAWVVLLPGKKPHGASTPHPPQRDVSPSRQGDSQPARRLLPVGE